MQDYNCLLTLEDISYNQLSQIKVFKMQLLERKDKQKWFVWTAQNKVQESDMNIDDKELDTSEFQTNIYEFYNRTDAQANFEKRFFDKTANKWVEKDFFKEKPGKFVLLNKEEKKKIMQEA